MSKAKKVFLGAINPKNIPIYINQMRQDFGTKFTILLISNYFGVKGVINDFATQVLLPFFTNGGWSSSEASKFRAIARMPWSIKGFGGILADVFPIFGYEKSSYFMIYTVLGAASAIIFTFVPMTRATTPDFIPVTLFFFINMQTAFCDLLCEGKYADLMKNNKENNGNVISFTYFSSVMGGLIPASTVGILSDRIPQQYVFAVVIPFAIQPAIFIAFGCMVNDKAEPSRNNRIDFFKIQKQGRVMIMALAIGVVGLVSVFIGMIFGTMVIFLYNLIAALALGVLLFFTTPNVIARVMAYVCLSMFAYLEISTYVDYWYTEECVENGPHFSLTFYRSYVSLISTFATFIGIWIWQAVFCHYKYRVMFWATTCIRVAASIFDLIIMNRWNIAIGIPDSFMFIIGSAIVYNVAFQMDFMPMALMCAKVCPKKVETAMFAIAAGYGNYGAAVSAFVGNFVASAMNVEFDSEVGVCSYENLRWMIVIGHFIMPLLTIPIVFVLIPNKYVYENLADESFAKSKYYYVYPDQKQEQIETK